MEWLIDFFTNWELLSTVIGWIVGLLGIGIATQVWNVIRSGRKMYKFYYENKSDWDEQAKDEYIHKSAAFFSNITTLWNTVFGKKKK